MPTPDTSPARKKPTAQDVANAAGVSLGTVSHVLTGNRYVRPETRERTERAIKELGFRPNRVAQSLVSRQTNTIGMVIPDIVNPFFAELARGAEDVLGLEGFATVFGNSDNDLGKEVRYLADFEDRRVDGLIVGTAAAARSDHLRRVAGHIPTVIVDRTLARWQGDVVLGDNLAGMALAVQHLAELGHKRIAMISGDRSLSTAREREQGFISAAAGAGLTVTAISRGTFAIDSGLEQAVALLSGENRPTAICAANDLLALGAIAGATQAGYRVPEDLSIVGYDDIAYARMVSPSLTTVYQSALDMGATAARLLLERIRQSSLTFRSTVLQPKLMVRASTAPPGRDR